MKAKPTGKYERAQKEVLAELRTLRLLIREVGGIYLAGLQAEAARVARSVEAAGLEKKPTRKQSHQMHAIQRMLQSLDVEPTKGRRRDLKEMEKLIKRLGEMIDTW